MQLTCELLAFQAKAVFLGPFHLLHLFSNLRCAVLAGIFYHLPYSNFIRLVGDNLAVLFVLRKESCRNSSGNYFLQNLAKLYLK